MVWSVMMMLVVTMMMMMMMAIERTVMLMLPWEGDPTHGWLVVAGEGGWSCVGFCSNGRCFSRRLS